MCWLLLDSSPKIQILYTSAVRMVVGSALTMVPIALVLVLALFKGLLFFAYFKSFLIFMFRVTV